MIDPTAPQDATYARYPSLQDRTCLVTCGADGIGAAIVAELAAQGAKVAFIDLQADKAKAVTEACVDAGPPTGRSTEYLTFGTFRPCRPPSPIWPRRSATSPCWSTTRQATTGTSGTR